MCVCVNVLMKTANNNIRNGNPGTSKNSFKVSKVNGNISKFSIIGAP